MSVTLEQAEQLEVLSRTRQVMRAADLAVDSVRDQLSDEALAAVAAAHMSAVLTDAETSLQTLRNLCTAARDAGCDEAQVARIEEFVSQREGDVARKRAYATEATISVTVKRAAAQTERGIV